MLDHDQPNEKKQNPKTAALPVKKSYFDLLPLPILLLIEASLTPSSVFNLAKAYVRFRNYLKTFSYWQTRFPSLKHNVQIAAEDIAAFKQEDAGKVSFYKIFINLFYKIENQVKNQQLLRDVEGAEEILERLRHFEKYKITVTAKDVEKLKQHCIGGGVYGNPDWEFLKKVADFVVEALKSRSYKKIDMLLQDKDLKELILLYTDGKHHFYKHTNGKTYFVAPAGDLVMPLLKAVEKVDDELIKYLLDRELLNKNQIINRLLTENDLDTLKAFVPNYIQLTESEILAEIDEQFKKIKKIDSPQKLTFFLSMLKTPAIKKKCRDKIIKYYLNDIILNKRVALLNELYKFGIVTPDDKFVFIYNPARKSHLPIDTVTSTATNLTALHLAILLGDVDRVNKSSEAELKACADITFEHSWAYWNVIGEFVHLKKNKEFKVSPLQLSIIFHSPETTAALLQKGADATEKNSLGHTALDVAKEMRADKVPAKTKKDVLRNSFLLTCQTFINKNHDYKNTRCNEGTEINIKGEMKNYKNYLDLTFFGRTILTIGFGDDLEAKKYASEQLTEYMQGKITVKQVPDAAKRGELGNIFYEFEAARKSFRQP